MDKTNASHSNMSVDSGIQCSAEVSEFFQKLKSNRKYRYVIYRVRHGNGASTIALDRVGNRENSFHDFIDDLPKHEARFAVYDFSYITPDWGMKDSLLFIFWTPFEASQMQARTVYSSSKRAVLETLRQGTALKQIEVTDAEDLTESNLMETLLPLREKGINLHLGRVMK